MRAIRVIVSVVVIVTVWEEAESRAVSEVAIAEITAITVMESAATETITPEAAGHPGTEAAAREAATVEAAGKAATVETATTKATVTTAHAATSATRQRHSWHSQANGRDRQ
jgi:hypothetical protein